MTSAVAGAIRHRPDDVPVLAVGGAVALGAGAVAASFPVVPVVLGVVSTFGLIVWRPVVAAYVFLAFLPFVAGIERGAVIPHARPNEMLQAFVTLGVIASVYVKVVRRETLRVRVTQLDRALVMFAVLASVWPVLWSLGRGRVLTSDDVFSTVVVWRLLALYALFRYVVRTREQVRRCFWIAVVGACAVAVLAVAQALGIVSFGALWGTGADAGRGGATLGSAIAAGDYLAYAFAVVLAWHLRGSASLRWLALIAGVLVLGSFGTGQFSAWIALTVVAAVIAFREGAARRLALRLLPVVALGLVVAWPVVTSRLSGFGSTFGVPRSWIGRIDNLTTFYLPELGAFRWLLGVRPNAVLQAPETWREDIYLESGILWLLWVGGVPLLAGFVWFLVRALRLTDGVARMRRDEVGIAALAAFAALCAMAVLTIIDQHVTLRGSGDLLFVLLGLSANRLVPASGDSSP